MNPMPEGKFPLPRENSGINGANEKSVKPMSGYARCMPLGHLSREASGCMSETLVRICSHSSRLVCSTQTHFLVRAAQTSARAGERRRDQLFADAGTILAEPGKPSVRGSCSGMVILGVRRTSSFPLGR